MLKRELYVTDDGSNSIYLPEWNEYYHSKKGAVQEAMHVFLDMGMHVSCELARSRATQQFMQSDSEVRKRNPENPTVSILEYGLGTGLNAFLTAQHAPEDVHINYTAVEAYPVTVDEIKMVDYGNKLGDNALYMRMHELAWESPQALTDRFTITKLEQKFQQIDAKEEHDVIYYDVFGPRVQPDLWSIEMIQAAYDALKKDGILVTYCAAGFVRRNMIAAGFTVERLPGPPGKREMLRGRKG